MIYYFSGSGNSRKIAEAIAEEVEGELINLNKFFKDNCHFEKGRVLVEKKAKLPTPINGKEELIFVHPTYAWRQPRILTSFLRHSKEELQNRDVYFVATAGSSFGGTEKKLIELCQDVGAEYKGLATIIMPENYTAMFPIPSKDQAAKIIDQGIKKAKLSGKKIKEGRRLLPDKELCKLPNFLSNFINPIFYSLFVKSKAFYADDSCISCGICEQICPLNCIVMEDDQGKVKPKWHNNCTHCMACINHCPQEAIEYGKKSQGKRRYFI